MQTTLVVLGVVCVAAAIVGGGLKAAGNEIPVIDSIGRQVMLGLFGVAVTLFASIGLPIEEANPTGQTTTSQSAEDPTTTDALEEPTTTNAPEEPTTTTPSSPAAIDLVAVRGYDPVVGELGFVDIEVQNSGDVPGEVQALLVEQVGPGHWERRRSGDFGEASDDFDINILDLVSAPIRHTVNWGPIAPGNSGTEVFRIILGMSEGAGEVDGSSSGPYVWVVDIKVSLVINGLTTDEFGIVEVHVPIN